MTNKESKIPIGIGVLQQIGEQKTYSKLPILTVKRLKKLIKDTHDKQRT
jgi:hypothetical protein